MPPATKAIPAMNTLTKWNPFKKSDELGPWQSSIAWDPFREMEDMMSRIQRTFAQAPLMGEGATALAEWSPSVDIAETEKEFILKAELPDLKKEDIKVNVQDGTISIMGERKVQKEEKDIRYHRLERGYGHFERIFTLPKETEKDKITSEYKEGVLIVHLPKNPTAIPQPHAIPVQ